MNLDFAIYYKNIPTSINKILTNDIFSKNCQKNYVFQINIVHYFPLIFKIIFRGCIPKFEIIPNYHQQGRKSETLTSDRLLNIFTKIVMDFLRYAIK